MKYLYNEHGYGFSGFNETQKQISHLAAGIDEQMTVGNISTASLTAAINQIRMLEGTIAGVENQLLEVRTQREVLCQSLWDNVKRLRSFVKGLYGDDSLQYELVGGKRLSDRKPRRTTTPAE